MIFSTVLVSVGCHFLRFSGWLRFLARKNIYDIRVHYYFLAFFLSVG